MKSVVVACLFMLASTLLLAQKKTIDYSVSDNWPIIRSQKISNDGKYVAYSVKTQTSEPMLVVKESGSSWKKEIAVIGNYFFSEDSRRLIITVPGDSVGIIELGRDSIYYLTQVTSPDAPENGNGRWVACQVKNSKGDVILFDLQTGKQHRYPNVFRFQFSPNGRILVLQAGSLTDQTRRLYWRDLETGNETCIGNGYNVVKFVFDEAESAVSVISVTRINVETTYALRYYQMGIDTARVLVDNHTPGIANMFVSAGGNALFSFNKKGNKIFFGLQNNQKLKYSADDKEGINVYHYQDPLLKETENTGPFQAVVDISAAPRVVRLEQPWDNAVKVGNNDDYVLIKSHAIGSLWESNWRISARPDIYLGSITDGSRKLLTRRLSVGIQRNEMEFSPGGKYVLWFDKLARHWFSYNIATGLTKNISRDIRTSLVKEDDHPALPGAEGLLGWSANDKAVYIYDRFDIWKADPDGMKAPVNITKGYGAKHNTRLRGLDEDHLISVSEKDFLFLSAFDLTTKNSGFFTLNMADGHLSQTIMTAKIFGIVPSRTTIAFSGASPLPAPLKARHAEVYLLAIMSASEYPNLFTTTDFSHFRPITDFNPQKEYDWYTTELMHWTIPGEQRAEGILYKPGNFDPKKKYPVIFFYYEKMADCLNMFLSPALSDASINIPWYTSHGYLVFVPDIYYKTGYAGQSAYNSVVSAARYLSTFPWVKPQKMGIQGHSFGGFETNYIVSHTSMFAAAAPSAGPSNWLSDYGVEDKHYFYEVSQIRMGASLWQNPQLYILNSPVFRADKVTTPVFIMQNRNDGSVAWNQGSQWFSDLSKLGKKAWMVAYAGEGHTIDTRKYQLDYSIRLGQFFDHFLKDAPAAPWLLKGKYAPVESTGTNTVSNQAASLKK